MDFDVIVSRHTRKPISELTPEDSIVLKKLSVEAHNGISAQRVAEQRIDHVVVYDNFFNQDDGQRIDIKCSDLHWQDWYPLKTKADRRGDLVGWCGMLSGYFLGNFSARLNGSPVYYISVELLWKEIL